jgi:hypothetical protein
VSASGIDWRATPQRGRPGPIEKYRNWANKECGLKFRTINQRMRTIRRFYDWCVREKFIERAPYRTVLVRNPRATRFLQHVDGTGNRIASPHFMFREMAVLCARHELGDLLYLKKQLKHRSLDMTALYAMNPAQDEALFNEIFDAHQEVKAGLLEHWLDPSTPLAGGAAAAIGERKIDTLKSRKELATNIASKVSIRATGHGWCLAQDDGCGGQGLYEQTRCVDCTDGLIDDRHKLVWQGIFEQQLELLEDAPSLGAGARRRIRIDVERSSRVLGALGVELQLPEDMA